MVLNRRYLYLRKGFTLVELLVVMVIIGMLMGLLLPGVQRIREAARRSTCAANLRQIGLAMGNYEAANTNFPPSWQPVPPDVNGRVSGWSVWALILPHLEQGSLYGNLDFSRGYNQAGNVVTADGQSVKVSSLRVPTYLCPSEVRDEARIESGQESHYPNNYGVNLGTWLIYDPATGTGGNGTFFPGSHVKAADIRDGLTYTLCAAEVKGWQPVYRDAGKAAPLTMPATPSDVQALGGTFSTTGHTEWVDGRSNHSGFTTTFKPNAYVAVDVSGTTYDVDWTNQREGTSTTIPNYGAITSRSYHENTVNVVMMDASVRAINNDIDLGVWRAFSTRNGRDLIPSKYQQR